MSRTSRTRAPWSASRPMHLLFLLPAGPLEASDNDVMGVHASHLEEGTAGARQSELSLPIPRRLRSLAHDRSAGVSARGHRRELSTVRPLRLARQTVSEVRPVAVPSPAFTPLVEEGVGGHFAGGDPAAGRTEIVRADRTNRRCRTDSSKRDTTSFALWEDQMSRQSQPLRHGWG